MRLVNTARLALFHLLLLFTLVLTNPTQAAVDISALLDEAPASAELIIVVPNLADLSDKVAALHDELGLDVPPMKDMLGELKRSIGLEEGLNEQGAVMIVMTNMAEAIQQDANEPPALMLVPVTDYKQLITGLGGEPANRRGGAENQVVIDALSLAGGQPAFARHSGAYAVIGSDEALVRAYEPAAEGAALIKSLGATKSQLDTADAAVIVNIAALAPAIEPFINQAVDQMGQELANAKERAEGAEAEMVAFGGVVMSMYIDAARAIVRDSQTGLATIQLTDDGLSFTESVQFKPDSPMAKMFANGTATAEQLNRLPNQPYLVAGAWNIRGLALEPLFNAADRIVQALPKEMMGGMSEMVAASIDMAKSVKAGGMVYFPPQQMAMMGQGAMLGVAVMETTDPEAYIQTYQETITKLNGLSFNMGLQAGAEGADSVSINAAYKPNVIQVDGIQVDEYQIQYQYPPQMMQQMGPMAPIFMMMGGMGQSGYVATKGRHVIMTTARDAQLVKQALASVEANDGLGTSGAIRHVREVGFPADACVEGHLSIAGLVSMGNIFMGMMGQPPIQIPADLPPVSWGAAVKDHSIITQTYVPIEVMKFVKDLTDQFQAMANPGGMHGGQQHQGDGPPPAPF